MKAQPPADLFAAELDRVVNDFVENATDEDVHRLLERAAVGFESKIETPAVIARVEASFYTQGSFCLKTVIRRRFVTPAKLEAADRNDLALAA